MSMKLTVIRRDPNAALDRPCVDYWCRDEDGNTYNVDLFVDGNLPSDLKDEDLIGKTIECRSVTPYTVIANDVKWPPVV